MPDGTAAVVLLAVPFLDLVSHKNERSVSQFLPLAVLSVKKLVFLRQLPSAAAWLL